MQTEKTTIGLLLRPNPNPQIPTDKVDINMFLLKVLSSLGLNSSSTI